MDGAALRSAERHLNSAELLGPNDCAVFEVLRPQARSEFVLIGDHAGNRIPACLGSLGLSEEDLQRHVAWDIGAAGLARAMSVELDALVILQNYSRLVIDCNRAPGTLESIVSLSERTDIPGNAELSAEDAEARRLAIFEPYHARIAQELDARERREQPTLLITLHSFVPRYLKVQRPWHIGVLYHRDARFAEALLEVLGRQRDLVIGNNEPYAAGDDTDYAVPVHGEARGLPHVELEIRQDLIADEAGQRHWAARLAPALLRAAKLMKQPS